MTNEPTTETITEPGMGLVRPAGDVELVPMPLPLGQFLDNGGDPRAELGDRWSLIEQTVRDHIVWADDETRERRAKQDRWLAERTAEGFHVPMADGSHDWDLADRTNMVVAEAWSADVNDDPNLIERLRPLLSDELVAFLDDPVLVLSERLELAASELGEVVKELHSAIETGGPLLRQIFELRGWWSADFPNGRVPDDDEREQWHARYPGPQTFTDPLFEILELVDPIQRSDTLGY